MKDEANAIDLESMNAFKRKFPNIEVKKPKWAETNATDEFRRMSVGDIVLFPIDNFRYNTVRNILYTCLPNEYIQGWSFSTKLDRPNKCTAVIRTA